MFWLYSGMYPDTNPACFGLTQECTWVPNLFVWVIVGYAQGYHQSAYPGTLRDYALLKTLLPYSLTLKKTGGLVIKHLAIVYARQLS